MIWAFNQYTLLKEVHVGLEFTEITFCDWVVFSGRKKEQQYSLWRRYAIQNQWGSRFYFFEWNQPNTPYVTSCATLRRIHCCSNQVINSVKCIVFFANVRNAGIFNMNQLQIQLVPVVCMHADHQQWLCAPVRKVQISTFFVANMSMFGMLIVLVDVSITQPLVLFPVQIFWPITSGLKQICGAQCFVFGASLHAWLLPGVFIMNQHKPAMRS